MEARSRLMVCTHGAGRHELHVLSWHEGRTGAPLFCVHALTRVAGDFGTLAEFFPDRPVHAPDMPGRGGSAWLLDSSLYGLHHYMQDCLQALDALELQQVDWIGTSMGGLVGMMLAAFHPARIRRLVLNDVGPFVPQEGLRRIAQALALRPRFRHFDDALRYCRAAYAGFGNLGEDDWRALARRSLSPDGTRLHFDPRIADNFNAAGGDVDLWPVYERIIAPVLALRGEDSDILRAEDAEMMKRLGPRAQCVTFPGCGHAPALMSAEQLRVIAGFLD